MKARVDAGTDVAMIGAWDADRGADAEQGHIFVLHTGADGGGPVDVYIDEPVPADVMQRLTPIGDELVLALPSGTLIVDGVEHYRARKANEALASRAVSG